ncbi:MAG: deazapurine DNA modification protein DpdA family protein [Candidatus Heimdallarchaeaceae archaeon]
MKEFYFVIPADEKISEIIHPNWMNQNLLISAANYFKKGVLNTSNHFFKTNMVRKSIIDCGIFEYYNKYHKFPYSVKEYTSFLNKAKPTYGVCMDMICLPHNILEDEEEKFNTNFKRIDFSVKNAIYNIKHAKHYKPISVLQGFSIEEFEYCIEQLHSKGALTPILGIGSLAKRKPKEVRYIVQKVKEKLNKIDCSIKLHGFGLSFSCLRNKAIRESLHSSDSLAWIFSIRKFGRLTQYNQFQRKMQEIDIGRNQWSKYLIQTYYAYGKYVEHFLNSTAKNIKNSIFPLSLQLSYKNRHVENITINKEKELHQEMHKLIGNQKHNSIHRFRIYSKSKLVLELDDLNKISIYEPTSGKIEQLPALRNGKKIMKKDIVSLSVSNAIYKSAEENFN